VGGKATAEVRVVGAHEFHGAVGASRIKARELLCGSVTIWDISAEAAEFDMRPNADHADHLTFAFVEHGTVMSKKVGEPWLTIDTSLVIAPAGVDRRIRFDVPTRILSVRVPSAELAGFVTDLPNAPTVHHELRMLDRGLLGFLTALMGTKQQGSAISKYAIEHLVLEMCGAILLDRMGAVWTQGSPGTALRDRALAVIAQQCEDMTLTPDRVARAVQSSLRQLQSVFADAGTTLTNSRFDVLTIEQVALRSGFANPMGMRRALRNVYGTGPSELRRSR